MRKLWSILITLAVLLYAGQAWAQMGCVSDWGRLPVLHDQTPTTAYLYWSKEVTGIDSALKKVVLLISTNNPPTIRKDSVITSIDLEDSLLTKNLTPGIKYFYRGIFEDSVTTCTTAVDSVWGSDLYVKNSLFGITPAEDIGVLTAYTHSWVNIQFISLVSPDSNFKKVVLLLSTSNPPTTRAESLTSSIASSGNGSDTIKADGLTKGTEYYFRIVATDSTTTDTTAVDSITTRANFGWNMAGIDTVYGTLKHSSFKAEAVYTSAYLDSAALKKLVIQVGTANPPTARADSDLTALATPDTLFPKSLTENVRYYYRFIGTDSTTSDTSAVDSISTLNFGSTTTDFEGLQGHTFIKVTLTVDNPDSAAKKILLLAATTNPPTTVAAGDSSALSGADTLTAVGLKQNTEYYFKVVSYDSTSLVDTSAVDSVTTLDLAQTTAVVDTTTSRFKVQVSYTGADSAAKKIVILCDTNNPPTTHADSDLTALASPDTVQVDGLTHQTLYYYRAIISDSAFTDTSAVGSVTTEGMTIALACVDTQYNNLTFQVTYTNVDSAAKKIVMLISSSGSLGEYSRNDSDLTGLVSPDTLNATSGTIDLLPSLEYWAKVIITDSTQVDTSDYYPGGDTEMTTLAYPYPTDYTIAASGSGTPDVGNHNSKFSFGYAGTYTKSSFSLGVPYWIGPFSWFSIQAKLFGLDNNHTYDSTSILLQTKKYGDWTTIDSLVKMDIDTITTTPYQYLLKPVDMGDTTLYWGDSLRVYIDVTDSATFADSALDLRGYEYWIEFKK